MGVAGGLVAGLNAVAGKFAGAFGLKEVEAEMRKVAAATVDAEGKVDRLKTLGAGLKVAFKNLGETLTDPTVIFGALMKGFNDVEKEQQNFRRLTGQNADAFRGINDSLTTTSEYLAGMVTLTKELGVNANVAFSPETVTTVAELTANMGMAGKEAANLAAISKISGTNLQDNLKSTEGQFKNFVKTNKTALNFGQVLSGVANASDSVKISLGGSQEAIGKAVMEAQKLGLTLDQVDNIAGKLLDFESSITAEMEAELLTGQQINLEKARQFALDNDLAGLAKEIGNNQAVLQAFSTGNRIAQEATAKAMGMSREEMSKMILQQKIQEGLTTEQAAAAADISLEEAQRLTTQQQITKAIEKMSQALAPIIGFFASLLSNSLVLKTLMVAIGTVMAVQMAKSALSFASSMKGAVTSSFSLLKNLSGSGSLMGKMYKGGQFMPGGGRAAAGGQRAGGLMGKIKGAFSAPEGLDKGAASVAGAADKTKGIDPAQGSGIKEFLTGLGDGLASIGKQFGKVVAGGVALGLALFAMGGGMALAMPLIAGSDPVLMLAFAASISAIGLTVAVMGKMGGDIIKGALALGIMAIALIPAAYAFSLLAGVDASSILAFSIAIPILGLSVLALGLIFTNPVTMFLFGAGILGLVSLGLAILPLAAAFSILKDVDIPTIGAGLMSLANKDLIEGLSSFGIAISSLATPLLISSIAFAILGPSLQSTAIGFEMLTSSNMVGTIDSLQILSTLSPGLMNTSKALLALAGSLTAVGIAGLIATPAMAVMSLFGGMGGEESSGKSSSGESSKEDGGMAKINANLEKLIAVISAGGDVYIDGAKVGKTVALATSKMG
jgi:hypothetical protein